MRACRSSCWKQRAVPEVGLVVSSPFNRSKVVLLISSLALISLEITVRIHAQDSFSITFYNDGCLLSTFETRQFFGKMQRKTIHTISSFVKVCVILPRSIGHLCITWLSWTGSTITASYFVYVYTRWLRVYIMHAPMQRSSELERGGRSFFFSYSSNETINLLKACRPTALKKKNRGVKARSEISFTFDWQAPKWTVPYLYDFFHDTLPITECFLR